MIILSLLPLLRANIVTHHGLSQTLHFSEMVFLVVFGDKEVSRIPKRYIGICGSWPVRASKSHVTTRVFSVTEYKKCTQTSKIIPYRWFRYTLLVPTVARVHFLHLKPLVCIPISTGSTWDIGTKNWCVIPQGFGSRMCTLTIPTICTINTVTKVVSRIKQWRDSCANNGPILKIISKHKFCHKNTRFAWAGGTVFPVVLLCQFFVLAGNRFWCYILMYLEYNTVVVLC